MRSAAVGASPARARPGQSTAPRTRAAKPAAKLTRGGPRDITSIVASAEGKTSSKRPRKRFSVIRFLVLLFVVGGAFGTALGYWAYSQIEGEVTDRLSHFTDYRPSRASRVFSSEGELIGEFFLEKRVPVLYESVPKHVKLA